MKAARPAVRMWSSRATRGPPPRGRSSATRPAATLTGPSFGGCFPRTPSARFAGFAREPTEGAAAASLPPRAGLGRLAPAHEPAITSARKAGWFLTGAIAMESLNRFFKRDAEAAIR